MSAPPTASLAYNLSEGPNWFYRTVVDGVTTDRDTGIPVEIGCIPRSRDFALALGLTEAELKASVNVLWGMRAPPCRPAHAALGDEPARIRFWKESLGRHPTREDVVHTAASALALRDRKISEMSDHLDEAVSTLREVVKGFHDEAAAFQLLMNDFKIIKRGKIS